MTTPGPPPLNGRLPMHELALGTAFLAGILGSLHCVAMCGGLATAMGATRASGASRGQPWLYQLGRIASYGTAGAIVGSLGRIAGMGFETSRWSQLLRLGTALMVIVLGLQMAVGRGSQRSWLRLPEKAGALLWRRLAPAVTSRLPRAPAWRALSLGMLWGWLPCGLVYSVLLIAAFAGGFAGGAATMLAFGLGTLPSMLGISYVSAQLTRGHGTLPRLLGALIVACGLWTASMPIAVLSGAHPHHAMGAMPMAMPMPMD